MEYKSVRDVNGRFQNVGGPPPGMTMGNLITIMGKNMAKDKACRPQVDIPVTPMTAEALRDACPMSMWKLSHSSVLMKFPGSGRGSSGLLVLTDPVFSERASPFKMAGPRRFSRMPITADEMPDVHVVMISHNHYDHLDEETIKTLAPKTSHFLVPLALGETLVGFGVPRAKIRELDWWQCTDIGDLRFVCSPAQHHSGRGLFDRMKTLWCSWSIHMRYQTWTEPALTGPDGQRWSVNLPAIPEPLERVEGNIAEGQNAAPTVSTETAPTLDLPVKDFKLFFSGDSGYHLMYPAIGKVCGPYDVTLMENGQYNREYWPYNHMLPEQTVRAHLELRGRWMVPIHNCTFDLGFHTWEDPLECSLALCREQGVNLCTPMFGERVDLLHINTCSRWWRKVLKQEDRLTAEQEADNEPKSLDAV
ncbi:putative Zn-dependent hydrolase of beta-lactamase [Gregarina niphandrodes]|uniref:Zn-dependent hydrolase of beta-lactamase n=1 Tax=Gregarina niphandrodes TaxID=110365 RepID=A0A023B0L3_GRENI|nr:putative Zn-dependent hydrolase of beta-lactamase [Gregarina niphandrodes]EZG45423.1 putative Zn-dependent hydrolase of beta-lactamase [Gregarina niphandrodes]|eukprot:XP_011132499.1 putative Zn-dependent hydrolase of beta-lactamase [Gregarina niphandrodes]